MCGQLGHLYSLIPLCDIVNIAAQSVAVKYLGVEIRMFVNSMVEFSVDWVDVPGGFAVVTNETGDDVEELTVFSVRDVDVAGGFVDITTGFFTKDIDILGIFVVGASSTLEFAVRLQTL